MKPGAIFAHGRKAITGHKVEQKEIKRPIGRSSSKVLRAAAEVGIGAKVQNGAIGKAGGNELR